MILLISLCTWPWWLPWLLSGLLGLLLGWLIWGRLRSRITELEGELGRLKSRNSKLEGDLGDCNSYRASAESNLATAESDLALLKGRVKEGSISTNTGATAQGIADIKVEPPKIKKAAPKQADLSAGIAGTVAASSQSMGVVSDHAAPKDAGAKNIYAALKEDNLQIVEGIGPKMNEVLNTSGIKTWSDLSNQNEVGLRKILDDAGGDRYRIVDPETWASQASFAAKGDWEGLIAEQKQLSGGKTGSGSSDAKVEKILIKMGVLKRWKQDDLTAVEGIGPKIAGLMRENGVNTWREMANSSVDRLKEVLAIGGDRFRLADPNTWPKQAEFAADGEWEKLKEYQDFLDGGK